MKITWHTPTMGSPLRWHQPQPRRLTHEEHSLAAEHSWQMSPEAGFSSDEDSLNLSVQLEHLP